MANLNEQKGTMNDALNQKEAVFLRHKKTISIAIVAIILVVAGITYMCSLFLVVYADFLRLEPFIPQFFNYPIFIVKDV